MKKILISIAMIIMAGTTIMAQSLMADTLAGFNISYGVPWYTQEMGSSKLTESQSMISAGVFYDATIIRLSADYSRSYGDYNVEGESSLFGEADTSSDKYAKSSLDLTVIGKFPIDLGAVKIWGGGGVMYSHNLTEKYDGDDISNGSNLNDFFLIAAGGLDVTLDEVVYLCPALTLGYNLTPNPLDDEVSGVDYTGYMWKISLGVAMRI
jgi:hypothetical protein